MLACLMALVVPLVKAECKQGRVSNSQAIPLVLQPSPAAELEQQQQVVHSGFVYHSCAAVSVLC